MAYLFGASTTDRIDCGTSVTHHASAFSVFVRFKVTQAVDNVTRVLQTLSDPVGLLNCQLYFENNPGTTNGVVFLFTNGGGTGFPLIRWTSGFTAGSTHTLVATYDGTNMRIYADTDATAKVTAAPSPSGNADTTGTQRFLIGDDGVASTNSADSTIYEVGWWPGTVLSGAECAGMGAATPPGTFPTDYWPLVSDAVALYGGHNGTVTGATVVAHSGSNLYSAAVTSPRRSLTLLGVG